MYKEKEKMSYVLAVYWYCFTKKKSIIGKYIIYSVAQRKYTT